MEAVLHMIGSCQSDLSLGAELTKNEIENESE